MAGNLDLPLPLIVAQCLDCDNERIGYMVLFMNHK
jgi:hypothetical protein